MAIDPAALPAPETAVAPAGDIAEAVAPVESAAEPSAQPAAEAPRTYTLDEVWGTPEYQSRKDREIAAAQAHWQKQESDRIAAQSAAAERERQANAQWDLLQRANNGDLDAQAELSASAYNAALAERSTNGLRQQWVTEADATSKKFANGDPELEARFNVRNFKTVADWTDAMAQHTAAEAVKRHQAETASARAVARNDQPNPDTSEMVGGYGGPVANLSLDQLNAQYAKAKDDGDSERVQQLKVAIRRKDAALAGARR